MTITALKITLRTFIAVVRVAYVEGALVASTTPTSCPLCKSHVRGDSVHTCSRGAD